MRKRLDSRERQDKPPKVELPKLGQELWIEHLKPDGQRIVLGKGRVIHLDPNDREIVLRREIAPGGIYDGLGVAKEPGDYAITSFCEGAWSYRTCYHAKDGRLKGEYFNINTPIEISPDRIRYVDLEIDVVKEPTGATRIIDEGKLTRAVEAGYLTKRLAQQARRTAEELLRRLG